jgi:tripartite-type tricarboxylate transporter receptor subunit TctC
MLSALRIVAILVCFGASPALADAYPAKPVKLIVSTSAGGITDIAARIFGAHITARTGQPVVIDNRAGASGNIAMEALAKAAPDGYTLGVANTGNILVNPHIMRSMPYDWRELVPVGMLGSVPNFLVLNSSVPANTLAEFVAYARANPDKVSYASAGIGTTPDLAAHEFARRAGLKLVFVPFRGTAPAVTAVVGGDVHATFVSMGPHMQFVHAGKLRILGATTPARVSYLPDVPTFAEQGFPGFETSTWFAMFAPQGTPIEIVDRLNGYIRELPQDADAKRRFDANYMDPIILTPAEFSDLLKSDAIKWERMVRQAGIKID